MWILTIVLLLSTGDTRTVILETDSSITGAKCKIAAKEAFEMNDYGLHVLSATCSRVKTS